VTQRSFPYTGASLATELDWSKLVRAMGGIDGIVADDPAGLELKVTANGASTVAVAVGSALVNGFFYESDAVVNLAVPANGGGTARLDRVVLRSSQTANSTVLTYVTGGTSAPALLADRTDVFDLPLAQITVAAGSSVVPSGNVADQRIFYGKPAAASLAGSRRTPTRGQIILEGSASVPTILIGTGSAWVQLIPAPTVVWTALPLASGWTNYGATFQTARYTKTRDGLVLLQGLVKATSNRPTSNTIATLPSGYRPSATHLMPSSYSDAGAHPRVDVRSDGSVAIYDAVLSGQYCTLSGIVFPAEA
jgi:hypothetical protein